MARLSARQEENGRNNENVILITAMAVLVLYNGMTGYYLYTSFHKVEDLSAVPVDISRLLFGILGAVLIIAGIIILAVCCFTKGAACILWSLGIMLTAVIADVYYTYKTAQKY